MIMPNVKIKLLEIHKSNVLKAKTLEEYKHAHSLYIQYCIDMVKAEKADMEAALTFIDASEKFENSLSNVSKEI